MSPTSYLTAPPRTCIVTTFETAVNAVRTSLKRKIGS
jgi:hypothetical protein